LQAVQPGGRGTAWPALSGCSDTPAPRAWLALPFTLLAPPWSGTPARAVSLRDAVGCSAFLVAPGPTEGNDPRTPGPTEGMASWSIGLWTRLGWVRPHAPLPRSCRRPLRLWRHPHQSPSTPARKTVIFTKKNTVMGNKPATQQARSLGALEEDEDDDTDVQDLGVFLLEGGTQSAQNQDEDATEEDEEDEEVEDLGVFAWAPQRTAGASPQACGPDRPVTASHPPDAHEAAPQRGGLGLMLDKGSMRVTQVMEGAPAHEAGLKPGEHTVIVIPHARL
jgi:hypothetical protein